MNDNIITDPDAIQRGLEEELQRIETLRPSIKRSDMDEGARDFQAALEQLRALNYSEKSIEIAESDDH